MKKSSWFLIGMFMTLLMVSPAMATMIYQQNFNDLNNGPLHNQDSWTCPYVSPNLCDIQTTVTHEGSKAVKMKGWVTAERILSNPQSKALVKVAVRVESGSGGFTQIVLFDPYPNRRNFGRVTFINGGIYITNNVTDELIQSFYFDTWYFAEIETDSPNGRYRARINGGPWIAWKNFVDNLTGTNLDVIWVRNAIDSQIGYFDTFSIEDLNTPTLKLPFKEGQIWWVAQGNSRDCTPPNPNEFTHCISSTLEYAWDFNWGLGEQDRGKPVFAPAAGWIAALANNCPDPQPSGTCNGGWGNYVIIDYGSGYYGLLAHLRTVDVQLNQQVLQGQQVGTVGSSGNATYGPHIHYQTQIDQNQNGPDANDQSIPSSFADVLINNGVPVGCDCGYIDCRTIDCNNLNTNCYKSGNIMR